MNKIFITLLIQKNGTTLVNTMHNSDSNQDDIVLAHRVGINSDNYSHQFSKKLV